MEEKVHVFFVLCLPFSGISNNFQKGIKAMSISASTLNNDDPHQLSTVPISDFPVNSASQTSTLIHPQGEGQITPIEPLSASLPDDAHPTAEEEKGVDNSTSGSRKRGRPRKNRPENEISLIAEVNVSTDAIPAPPGYVSVTLPPSSSDKKRRGRPPGSGRKKSTRRTPIPPIRASQNKDIGITVRHLIAYAIFVNPGEDLAAKITNFAQQGSASIFISSVYGALSSATLRRPTSTTGSVTYEGHYDIVNLSGSLIQSEDNGRRVWSGGLTISLCGPANDTILVGGVAGSLIAATPVQVIVSTFDIPERKESEEPETVDPANTTGAVNESAGAVAGAGAGAGDGDGDGDGDGGGGVGGDADTLVPDNSGTCNHVNTPGSDVVVAE